MLLLATSVGCSSSLEKEAMKHAREHWKLTQLDGSNYLCEITAATKPSGIGAVGSKASKTVFELRNIKVEVSSNSLSEANKLNGVEWEGQVHLEAEAFRHYSPQPYSGGKPDKTWSDWISRAEATKGYVDALGVQNKTWSNRVSRAQAAKAGPVTAAKGYVDTLGVQKIKGEWKVVQSLTAGGLAGLRSGDVIFKQVEASDLPK